MKILMVCLGNICRSPIAEGLLRHKAAQRGLAWTVHSAGTNGYHTGEPPHRHSQQVCRAAGIDISAQRARDFSPADFEYYDHIYAMATDVYEDIRQIGGPGADMSKVSLLLNELEPGCDASVPDPWYGDASGYQPVYDLIERACEAVLHHFETSR